jgi:hypothetical protein
MCAYLSFDVQESETLMKQCLKWSGTLARELIKLVDDKAQGNPLMIKEVMITLAGKGKLVSVEPTGEFVEPTPRSSGSSAPRCVVLSKLPVSPPLLSVAVHEPFVYGLAGPSGSYVLLTILTLRRTSRSASL